MQKIENLDTCTRLTELWLGKNKITELAGMSTLKNLKILSIQSNRITKLEGLEDLESLEELYISHNGIKKLEGLEKNVGDAPTLLRRGRLTQYVFMHADQATSAGHWQQLHPGSRACRSPRLHGGILGETGSRPSRPTSLRKPWLTDDVPPRRITT